MFHENQLCNTRREVKSRQIPAQTSRQAVTRIAQTCSAISKPDDSGGLCEKRGPCRFQYAGLTENNNLYLYLFISHSPFTFTDCRTFLSRSMTMDGSSYTRGGRGRGSIARESGAIRGRPLSRNKHWSANDSRGSTPNHSDSERWERGGHRGGGRGRGASRGAPRKFPNVSLRVNNLSRPEQQPVPHEEEHHEDETPHVEEDVNGEDGHDEEMFEDDEPDQPFQEIHEPELDNPEEREKFYQEVCPKYLSFRRDLLFVAGESKRSREESSNCRGKDG